MSFNHYTKRFENQTISTMDIRRRGLEQLEQNQMDKDYLSQSTKRFENQTAYLPPIIDMRNAYSKVRQSKVTMNPNLVKATTTKTYL